MDLNLKGKTVLVTGSSRGLGRIIAERYLVEGALVTLVARGEESLRKTEKTFARQFGDRVSALTADISEANGIELSVDFVQRKFGSLDILVANAGLSRGTVGPDVSEEEWQRLLRFNLLGPALLIQAFAPLLKKTRGNAVFISSIAGRQALPAPVAYSIAKSGLLSLTRLHAITLGPEGVRINAVCPGNILLPGGLWEKRLAEDAEGIETYIAKEVPLQRFATGEEIAHAVLFLSSECSAFTTGATLVVDGGQTRGFL